MKAPLIRQSALFCLIALTALGFYSASHHSPEELGLSRARIDDRGLLQLTIDQFQEAISLGDMVQVRALMVTSETHGAEIESPPAARTPSITHTLTGLNELAGRARRFTTDGVEISGQVATARAHFVTSGIEATLQFRKIDNLWKLVPTAGLLSVLQTPEAEESAGSEPDFILYEDPETADTFLPQPVSRQHGITRLTRKITVEKLERQLFAKPYSGVLFSEVNQLNGAPFFTARYVQLVTDPAWNRVLYGDYEGWIKAYGNTGVAERDLNRPHGIDRDSEGNIYVADTGNNRIVAFRLEGNGPETELVYRFAFGSEQLSQPYDVAWDGRGTPFDSNDDMIWVADTGNDRLLGYSLLPNGARVAYVFGESGNGRGQLFKPKAVAVGRTNGLANGMLYVADTGNRRLVRLSVEERRLDWNRAVTGQEESQFLSLDVDHWGNVYASDYSYRSIRKYSASLVPIAAVEGVDNALLNPVNFNIAFGKVYVEAENESYWAGYDQAFSIEKWSDNSGAERYQLALGLNDFTVRMSSELNELRLAASLTDHGKVTMSIVDDRGTTVRSLPSTWMVPGSKELVWDRRDDAGGWVPPGMYRVQLSAESGYGSMTSLRETPELYLPLYYHEESGTDDPHLTQGTVNLDWGSAPHESRVIHPAEVVYRFTGLNPNVEYEIKAQFYNKVGDYLKQRISVDGSEITPLFELPAGLYQVAWTALPRELHADGEVELRISKTAGQGNAMVSQLWIREADYDPANPPVIASSSAVIPEEFALAQNYPNPFNPTTSIEFSVPAGTPERVTLRVFNMIGQTVATLVDQPMAPGRHRITWNGRDQFGRTVSTGVYFYQLNAGKFVETRKLILMK